MSSLFFDPAEGYRLAATKTKPPASGRRSVLQNALAG
jgi:hypothetical protein